MLFWISKNERILNSTFYDVSTSSNESVGHILAFPHNQELCLSFKHTSVPTCLAKYLIWTHNCCTCHYCINNPFHISIALQHINFFFAQSFTTSFELFQAFFICFKSQSSNKQDADKAVHCDAISKARPEDLHLQLTNSMKMFCI